MKRKERHQLKENEFARLMNEIYSFMFNKRREILIVISGIVILVVIFIGVRLIKAHDLKKESRLLTEILETREMLNEDPGKLNALEELAGKGKFSRLAYLELAAYWYEKGDVEKALAYLEKTDRSRKDELYVKIHDLKAQILCVQKDYEQALQIYQKLEEMEIKKFPLDIILFNKAKVLEKKGNIDEALNVFKKIQEEFPQSYYGYEARMIVSRIEGGN